MVSKTPEEFIKNFKAGFNEKSLEECFTQGNCWFFAKILKDRFANSEIYYDPIMNHFVTKVNDNLYDIKGKVISGSYVPWEEYKKTDELESNRIYEQCILKEEEIRRIIMKDTNQQEVPALEELEWFNTDEKQYSEKEIKMDDIISEKKQLNESENDFKVFIGLINSKPVFNESKNIDAVVVSNILMIKELTKGKYLIEMFACLDQDSYNQVMDYALNEENRKFDEILIDKVNNRNESANLVVSQYIDAILCENNLSPVNKRVYSISKGSLLNYDDTKISDKVDNLKTKPYLNESFDFYFNGFNKKEWIK